MDRFLYKYWYAPVVVGLVVCGMFFAEAHLGIASGASAIINWIIVFQGAFTGYMYAVADPTYRDRCIGKFYAATIFVGALLFLPRADAALLGAACMSTTYVTYLVRRNHHRNLLIRMGI
jgi:hypothetical protein